MVLTCEMCGASLDVNKAINDVVICEYCDSASNIHGFIHLNMSSDERAAALMKRGFVLIEFKFWDKAKYVLNKAVTFDSSNAKAYLGLLMVDTKSTKEEQLSLHMGELTVYEHYRKALQFADEELKIRLERYNAEATEHKRQIEERQEEKRRQDEERRKEKQREWEKRLQEIEEEEKENKANFIKKVMVMALALGVVLIVSFIFRTLTIENLRTFSDLSAIVELVHQEAGEDEVRIRGLTYHYVDETRRYNVNVRGLTYCNDNSRYVIRRNLVGRVGFSTIYFSPSQIMLGGVTEFAGIEFVHSQQVRDEINRRFGTEIEIHQTTPRRVPGSVVTHFSKNDVYVIISVVGVRAGDRNTWFVTVRKQCEINE